KERAVVVAANDGKDGQVTSTTGALTLRTGDFFSNQAKEQMRITPEGNVGIGTQTPEAKLDVAGTIRARGGIVFDDGSVLSSASAANSKNVTVNGSIAPAVAGTGSTNQISKWTDNAGTLGNSSITEANGNVGIGTTSPVSTLHLAGPAGVNAITLNTPGNQKFRFQTVAGIPNWAHSQSTPSTTMAGSLMTRIVMDGFSSSIRVLVMARAMRTDSGCIGYHKAGIRTPMRRPHSVLRTARHTLPTTLRLV